MNPLLLQLSDSAFPTGAFAHSLGLESMRQLGLLRGEETLVLRLRELVWSTAYGALPFLSCAHRGDPVHADRVLDAFLSSHVANRASRAQGQSLLLAAGTAFEAVLQSALRDALPFGHLAVAFGAVGATLSVSCEDARLVFLFGSARGALSAAVRLGVVGPLRAQRVLFELQPLFGEATAETRELAVHEAQSTSPLLDLTQAAQDRLYSRLFQS